MKVQQIVDLLNDIVANDPDFAHDLIEKRIPVSNHDWFDRHPGIVLYSTNEVGPLGIFNAIAALDGEMIEAVYDDETERLTGFRLRTKERKQTDAYAEAAI